MLRMEIEKIESTSALAPIDKIITGDVLRMRIMKSGRVDLLCAEGEDRPKYCDFFTMEKERCVVLDEDRDENTFEISLVNAKRAEIKKFENVFYFIIEKGVMRIETNSSPNAYEFYIDKLMGSDSENAKPIEVSIRYPSVNRSDDWDKLSKRSYELAFSIAKDLKMISEWVGRFEDLPKNTELMTFVTDSEIEIWSTSEDAVRIPFMNANNLDELAKEVERVLKDIERYREKIAKKENEENDGNTEA